MTRNLHFSLIAFLRARLSPTGYMGLHLTLGVFCLIGAGWLFGSIAEDVVTADQITLIDAQIAQWLHVNATPVFIRFMLVVTHLHGTLGILGLSLLTAVFFRYKKHWYWLLTLVIAVPGGLLVNVLLKHVFQRVRPIFDDPFLTLATYSFPSGHTAGATLFYGILAAYFVCHTTSWRWRILIVFPAALLIVLVGLSRMYLGVHYLSDVLAAIAASSAWLAFSLTAISTLRRHKAMRHGQRSASGGNTA